MSLSQTRIEVKHLSKVYYQHVGDALRTDHFDKNLLSPGDKIVLDDVNFEFNSGEIVGVLGRNGAGKSTLLSILAGVSKQTHGEVNICGKVTAVMTLGIGLREDLSGRENIYLDGQIQGKTRAEITNVIDEIIEFAELGNFIDKPVKTYSTGMKSRLAFSMLVGIEPEILIIDEALSAGDAFFAEKATKKIKEICKKGKIVIIVSHAMATLEAMCNRCIWLENGSILMDDEPVAVTQSYLQKIREEDQARDIKQRGNISHTVAHANYKITDVSLKLAGSDYEQSIFYTKDNLTVECKIKKIQQGNAIINFMIERIDGFIISHEQFDIGIQYNAITKSFMVVQLSLPSLVLNQGYYQLKFELYENNIMTNDFVRFFEVKNNHLAKGGVSLLHYPAEIVSINEEANLCSDSIELIAE